MGRGLPPGMEGAGYLQLSGQGLKFVQDFGEEGKLVSSEDFVDQFITCGRVVDAVVVFAAITVEVVVLQEKVFCRATRQCSDRCGILPSEGFPNEKESNSFPTSKTMFF